MVCDVARAPPLSIAVTTFLWLAWCPTGNAVATGIALNFALYYGGKTTARENDSLLTIWATNHYTCHSSLRSPESIFERTAFSKGDDGYDSTKFVGLDEVVALEFFRGGFWLLDVTRIFRFQQFTQGSITTKAQNK